MNRDATAIYRDNKGNALDAKGVRRVAKKTHSRRLAMQQPGPVTQILFAKGQLSEVTGAVTATPVEQPAELAEVA